MYRKQIRRRRAALALLIGASFVLLTAWYSEGTGGPLHSAQRAVAALLAPVEEGASRALKPASDLVSWFDETFEARGENERLRDELNQLRRADAKAQTAAAENRRLRKLVKLDLPPASKPVTARVIGRSPTVWYSTLTIDKGSSSGIQTDQPAVNEAGLVGRVSETTPGTAKITLITDHTSAVSGQVVPDGIGGVVKPEVGDPEDLLLDFIEKGKPVRRGQVVVTAGWRSDRLESLFPRGIPIGRVIKATLAEQETYQRVHIRPFADIRRIDFVQVLTGKGADESASTARASLEGDGGGE